MKVFVGFMLVLVVVSATPAEAQNSNVFYGGGIGLSFGTIDFIEIAPMIGVQVTDEFSTGISLLYRYRNDSRYSPSLSTNDYGGSIFARYHFLPNLFAQTEYEYLNFEYHDFNGGKKSDNYSSFLAGAGMSQPLGHNVAMHAAVLYNFSYSDKDFYRPYDSPWVIRVGVSAGF
jgi:opacity protein-like surface antigen